MVSKLYQMYILILPDAINDIFYTIRTSQFLKTALEYLQPNQAVPTGAFPGL